MSNSYTKLAEATPATRDRYADFLRGFSICVVVLGHLTMAVITVQSGAFRGSNLIAEIHGMWILTWVFQIIPIFFFVGGFSNSVTLDSVYRKGGNYVVFMEGRIARLLRPVVVLLVVWFPLAALLDLTKISDTTLRNATRLVSQPLWFIGAYLIIVSLAPPMLALHRRYGLRVLIWLIAAVAAIDIFRFNADTWLFAHLANVVRFNPGDIGVVGFATGALRHPLIGNLNFLFVWLFAQQLGFFYADGRLTAASRKFLFGMAAAGIGALLLLVNFGPYPGSMVGLPGKAISNMDPPNICLVALTTWQIALAMLLRPAVSKWLQRIRVWAGVIAVNSMIMTMFLWHLTSLLVAVAIAYRFDIPTPNVGSGDFWLWRIYWIGFPLLLLMIPLVLFSRFERPAKEHGPLHLLVGGEGLTTIIVGDLLIIYAICGFATGGIAQPLSSRGSEFLGLGLNPIQSAVHLFLGLLLVRECKQVGKHTRLLFWAIGMFLLVSGVMGTLYGTIPDFLGNVSGLFGASRTTANIFALNLGSSIVHLVMGATLIALFGYSVGHPPRAKELAMDGS